MNAPESSTVEYPSLRPAPNIGLGATLIGAEEEANVLEVVRSGKLFRYIYDAEPADQGKMTGTLERELAALHGTRFALALTSGTAALHVSLMALGVGPGDEVIVPAWSWISCYTTVALLGAKPILAEIDESFCLDPEEIDRLVTPKTKVVLVVHYQGVVAAMDPILEKARTHGLSVLEDAAESPGAIYNGNRVCSMGDIGILSFQFNKCITAGEGGAVLTNDPELYERAVRAHDLGLFRPYHSTWTKATMAGFPATQYRMNELTAAVGLAQVRKLEGLRATCRELSEKIIPKIKDLQGIKLRQIPANENDCGYEIYFQVKTPELAVKLAKKLQAHNVNCRKMTRTYPHYAADYCTQRTSHAESANVFRDESIWPAEGYRVEDFPKTNDIIDRFVVIPLGPKYSLEDAEYVGDCILAAYSELADQLN